MRRSTLFWTGCLALAAAAYGLTAAVTNDYAFFAGYVVLQFVLLATAWNIAGGYAGYVNFGTAGFFGAGAYAAVAVSQSFGASLWLQIACAAAVGALLGLGVGYLSVRLRGIYYSIATIAVAVILEAIVLNWPLVGDARGLSIARPAPPPGFASYTSFLFVVMAVLAIAGVAIARTLERSMLGRAFAAIRDNEPAAEACGVPTLFVKCMATTLSGALIAVAGAPYALYASYIDPTAAFDLNYSLSALAMPLLGGTSSWIGPVIGAAVLAVFQQILAVTASSQVNLLALGLILVGSVIFIPGGLYAMFKRRTA